MSSPATFPALDLTGDLKELVALATREDAIDDLLRRGLDWLGRIADYDLATVFMLRGDKLVVRGARGPLAHRVRGHSLELSDFPTIREALETRRARAYTEDDHSHGDGDPFDGVLDLPPGHSCMIVPLYAGGRSFGVLSLDRTRCERYPQNVVDLVEVYCQILALAIVYAEQKLALERLHHQDHERAKLLEAEIGGDPESVLETSQSVRMREVVRRARQVARADTPVLILGETGTGKERLSRAIHAWSSRNEHPFVTLNCAAIPSSLIESELFGHVKGAFTGATKDRAGRFQMANGGTLLLDEIGELPIELQAKLLRVLQEGTFEPVGSDRTTKVDVRILAATHLDLQRAIAERRFREDLYYRLNVFPLVVPALRDRREDLPELCRVILSELSRRTGRAGVRISEDGLAKLLRHTWPGNVRELSNVLERAMILSPAQEIGPDELDVPGARADDANTENAAPAEDVESATTMHDVQRRHIERTLEHTGGRIYGRGGAAELLGMKPSTLQSRMKKLGITRSRSAD